MSIQSNQQAILTAIQDAIKAHGPICHLDDIYTYVRNHEPAIRHYQDEEAIIRNIIYRHSSDCEIFRGTFRWDSYDLFYAPKGIGSGLWSIWPDELPLRILIEILKHRGGLATVEEIRQHLMLDYPRLYVSGKDTSNEIRETLFQNSTYHPNSKNPLFFYSSIVDAWGIRPEID